MISGLVGWFKRTVCSVLVYPTLRYFPEKWLFLHDPILTGFRDSTRCAYGQEVARCNGTFRPNQERLIVLAGHSYIGQYGFVYGDRTLSILTTILYIIGLSPDGLWQILTHHSVKERALFAVYSSLISWTGSSLNSL